MAAGFAGFNEVELVLPPPDAALRNAVPTAAAETGGFTGLVVLGKVVEDLLRSTDVGCGICDCGCGGRGVCGSGKASRGGGGCDDFRGAVT